MLDYLKDAANSVVEAVDAGVLDMKMPSCLADAKEAIKANLNAHEFEQEIDVEFKDLPDAWKEWGLKTGLNSLCTPDSWSWLAKCPQNEARRTAWAKLDIKKIYISVMDECENDLDWCVAQVAYRPGDHDFNIIFLPTAKYYISAGYWSDTEKSYWCIGDVICQGLNVPPLTGKCLFKSGNLQDFLDEGEKCTRWFELRHWVMYWYQTPRQGWNTAWSDSLPPRQDGKAMDASFLFDVTSMPTSFNQVNPEIATVNIEGPTFPGSPPQRHKNLDYTVSSETLSYPKNRWAPHGYVELKGLLVKTEGNKLILSGANITHFRVDSGNKSYLERKEKQRMELSAPNEAQAESWKVSLIAGGAKLGEEGGCCIIS